MASIDTPTDCKSIVNAEHPHDECYFEHMMLYTMGSGECFVSWSFSGDFPRGITTSGSGKISGDVVLLDDYHPVKDYISNEWSSRPDGEQPLLSEGQTITVFEIKQNKGEHITGIDSGVKGHKAYDKDNPGGDLTKFHFTSTLHYKVPSGGSDCAADASMSKDHYIQVVPNNDPKLVIHQREAGSNDLKDDNGNLLTAEEYITFREAQGHNISKSCL